MIDTSYGLVLVPLSVIKRPPDGLITERITFFQIKKKNGGCGDFIRPYPYNWGFAVEEVN